MKKIIAIILALVLALSFVACSKNSDKNENSNSKTTTKATETTTEAKSVDLDLTKLSSTVVYSEVYNMLITPDDYKGKIIKAHAEHIEGWQDHKNERSI